MSIHRPEKSFWQKYWTYIVICAVMVSLLGFLGVYNSHLQLLARKEFGNRLTMFKKPPKDAVEGGHWHADGTWHNEAHPNGNILQKPPRRKRPITQEPHPHDLLSDEEHEDVHRHEREKIELELEQSMRYLEDSWSVMGEDLRADMEQQEFERLIPNFQRQILHYEDYDFILTYPTPEDILRQYSDPESLAAFCNRFAEFQSLLRELSDEINKRPAFAKRIVRYFPEFMEKLDKVSKLEIPQFNVGRTNDNQDSGPNDDEGSPNDDEGGPNTDDD